MATPANTTGMGAVQPGITDGVPVKKKRKMKSLKDFIKESVNEINGFAILKPGFLEHEDEFIKMLNNNGWSIIQKKKIKLTLDQAKDLYSPHKDKEFYNDLCKYMSSDECLVVICSKDVKDPIADMKKIKNKVRDAWGESEMKNAMHSSDSLENVVRESKICANL